MVIKMYSLTACLGKGDFMDINNEKAFTLLEIIIAIAIISVITNAIFSFYFNGWDLFDFSNERVKFQRDHRLIESWVSRYVRKAIQINDNPAGEDELKLL